jgi:hypothetical protein
VLHNSVRDINCYDYNNVEDAYDIPAGVVRGCKKYAKEEKRRSLLFFKLLSREHRKNCVVMQIHCRHASRMLHLH